MQQIIKQRAFFFALILLLFTGCTSVIHKDNGVTRFVWGDKEKAIAEYLENFGRKVVPCSTESKDSDCQQGDAFIDGVLTAFRTLEKGATPSLIGMAVIEYNESGGQAHDMIIDARGTGLTKDKARAGMKWGIRVIGGVKRITIIGDDYFITQGV